MPHQHSVLAYRPCRGRDPARGSSGVLSANWVGRVYVWLRCSCCGSAAAWRTSTTSVVVVCFEDFDSSGDRYSRAVAELSPRSYMLGSRAAKVGRKNLFWGY